VSDVSLSVIGFPAFVGGWYQPQIAPDLLSIPEAVRVADLQQKGHRRHESDTFDLGQAIDLLPVRILLGKRFDFGGQLRELLSKKF